MFREKNNNVIKIHALSFDGTVQLPLGHREIAAEFCLNYSFIVQLTLTSPDPNSSEVLALALAQA